MSILDSRAVSVPMTYSLTGIPASGNRYLTITNDSPFQVQFYFDNNSGDAQTIPAGSLVENVEPAPGVPSLRPSLGWGGKITIMVLSPLGGTAPQNPPAQQVIIEGFSTRQESVRFGLARSIGGTVSVTNSTAIIAAGQVDGITVNFVTPSSVGFAATDEIDIRPTVNDNTHSHGLVLDSYDGAAYNHELSAYAGVSVLGSGGLRVPNGGLSVLGGPTSLAGGGISNINGEATVGTLGVPVEPAASLLQNIIVLTAVNVINFIPAHNGFYRISVGVRLGNGVSGNAITVLLTYRDAGGIQSANMKFMRGSIEALAAGVTSFANGTWAGEPLTFYATTAGAITLAFTDPTNTPNDFVSAVLERLA